jgi:hypothetical protein
MSESQTSATDDYSANEGILQETREIPDDKRLNVIFACGVLQNAEGKRTVCFPSVDYGDGEGVRMVEDWVEAVNDSKILKEGEQLYMRAVGIRLPEAQLERASDGS